MTLDESISNLKGIAKEAKDIYATVHEAITNGQKVGDDARDSLKTLAENLDEEARAAAAARRDAEIALLDELIEAHESTLAVEGLSQSVIDAVKGDLIAKRAKRARLAGEAGSDFGGIVTASEVKRFEALLAEVQQELKTRKTAGALLASATKIADIALTVAAKFAM